MSADVEAHRADQQAEDGRKEAKQTSFDNFKFAGDHEPERYMTSDLVQ